jgi:hypothetical protein
MRIVRDEGQTPATEPSSAEGDATMNGSSTFLQRCARILFYLACWLVGLAIGLASAGSGQQRIIDGAAHVRDGNTTEIGRDGKPVALLARHAEGKLAFAGGALIALPQCGR